MASQQEDRSMSHSRTLPALAAFALLAACDGHLKMGNEADAGGSNQSQSAAGQAQDGRLTVKAPGLDMSINIPEEPRSAATADADTRIIPPGATIGGLHVQGEQGSGRNGGGGAVEMTFTAAQPPEQVAAWYRDPARAADFTVSSTARQGSEIVIAATPKPEGEAFTVRLRGGAGGGTEARLVISERN